MKIGAFGLPGKDPSDGLNPPPSTDIFAKKSGGSGRGGGAGRKPQPKNEHPAEEAEIWDNETSAKSSEKEKDKRENTVVLSNPAWDKKETAFNEKAVASVKA